MKKSGMEAFAMEQQRDAARRSDPNNGHNWILEGRGDRGALKQIFALLMSKARNAVPSSGPHERSGLELSSIRARGPGSCSLHDSASKAWPVDREYQDLR